MHAVVVFEDYDTGKLHAQEKWDLYGFSSQSTTDVASVSVYLEWVFYKTNLGSEIGTFMSCQYNQFFTTDYTIEGQRCNKCTVAKPVSYGFDQTKCESCNDVASYVDNSPAIVRFLFTTACPIDVEKTVGDDGVIKDEEDLNKDEIVDDIPIDENTGGDQDSGTDDNGSDTTDPVDPITPVTEPEVTEPDGSEEIVEDSNTGLIIFIVIGTVLILGAVTVFAVFKIMQSCKRERVKTRPVEAITKEKTKKKKSKKEKSDKSSARSGKNLGEGMKIKE